MKQGFAQLALIAIILLLITTGLAVFLIVRIITTYTPSPLPVEVMTKEGTPTPDPTANWKTFTNNDYGFSVKYPPQVPAKNYSLEELYKVTNAKKPETSGLPEVLASTKMESEDFEIEIWVFNNKGLLSENDWFGKYGYYPSQTSENWHSEEVPNKKIIIGNYDAIEGYPKGMLEHRAALLTNNDNMYLFYISYNDPSDNNKVLANQILSTFKFIDK